MVSLTGRSSLATHSFLPIGRWLARLAGALLWLALWPLVANSQMASFSGSSQRPIVLRGSMPSRHESELYFLLSSFQRRLWLARTVLLLFRVTLLVAAVLVVVNVAGSVGVEIRRPWVVALVAV